MVDFVKKQIIFLFANRGEKISFKNDNIVVTDNGKVYKEFDNSVTQNYDNLEKQVVDFINYDPL